MGQPPDFKIIKRSSDGKKWEIIGAAWTRDNDQGFSISFEPNGRGGEKIKCLMVKNTPKPKTETSSGAVTQEDDTIPF